MAWDLACLWGSRAWKARAGLKKQICHAPGQSWAQEQLVVAHSTRVLLDWKLQPLAVQVTGEALTAKSICGQQGSRVVGPVVAHLTPKALSFPCGNGARTQAPRQPGMEQWQGSARGAAHLAPACGQGGVADHRDLGVGQDALQPATLQARRGREQILGYKLRCQAMHPCTAKYSLSPSLPAPKLIPLIPLPPPVALTVRSHSSALTWLCSQYW